MKYCSIDSYCGYRYQEGSLSGCKYDGYCDHHTPRDSRPLKKKVIQNKETKKEISLEDVVLEAYKAGQHIVYCDIEGLAEIDGTYYILDECGSWIYLPDKYEVILK